MSKLDEIFRPVYEDAKADVGNDPYSIAKVVYFRGLMKGKKEGTVFAAKYPALCEES